MVGTLIDYYLGLPQSLGQNPVEIINPFFPTHFLKLRMFPLTETIIFKLTSGKRPLGRPRKIWENNIKWDLRR
jgi:hypothetical protein